MLEKAKSFVKDHEKEIVFTGGIIAGVIIGVILCKRFDKKMVDLGKQFSGKRAISWTPDGNGFMTLEKVKTILDANVNNSESFAIFREGLDRDPSHYICLMMTDNVIIPE